jgi:uncharacterized membrane protein (UPF0127 family)
VSVEELRRFLIGAGFVILLGASILIGYYVYWAPKTKMVELGGVTLTVELATTPAAQQQGLSGRDSMPLNHGMLFIFDQEGHWSFWMYEMKFPLDIIWFDINRKAVFFELDLQPCTPTGCPVYTPPVNTMYVLEVNAGFVSAHEIILGDSFYFV